MNNGPEAQRTTLGEYKQLTDRLQTLAKNYGAAKRSSSGLLDAIAKTSATVTPAGASLQKFIGSLSVRPDKAMVELNTTLASARTVERGLAAKMTNAVRWQKELEQRADEFASGIRRRGVEMSALRKKIAEGTATRDDQYALQQLKAANDRAKQQQRMLIEDARFFDKEQTKLIAASEKARRELIATSKALISSSQALDDAVRSAGTMVKSSGIYMAVKEGTAFNRTLLEANSNLSVRRDLLQSALTVQMTTGDSLEEIASTMQILRQQTQLYDKNLVATLTTASRLRQSLGASADDVSTLLNTARQLRIPFEQVGDAVANLVDKTSLSTRDAIGIIGELRDVIASYNLNSARLEPATRFVVALEDSLRAVGGEAGTAAKLLSNFSDMSKKGGLAMAFGAGGPDVGTDPARFRELTQNIADYLAPMRQNMLVFPQMAAMFGLSAREAQNLIDAQQKLAQTENSLANNQKTLEERFKETSANTAAVWGQLTRSLKAAVITGLAPLTFAIDHFNKAVVELRDGVRTLVPEWARLGVQVVASVSAIGLLTYGAVRVVKAFQLISGAFKALSSLENGAFLAKVARDAAAAGGKTPGGAAKAVGGAVTQAGTAAATQGLFSRLWQRQRGGVAAQKVVQAAAPSIVKQAAAAGATSAATGAATQGMFSRLGEMLKSIARPDAGRAVVARTATLATTLRGAMAAIVPFLLTTLPSLVMAALPVALAVGLPLVATFAAYRFIKDRQYQDVMRDMERMRKLNSETARSKTLTVAQKVLADRPVTTSVVDEYLKKASNVRVNAQQMFVRGLKEGGSERMQVSLQGAKGMLSALEQSIAQRMEQVQATQNREGPTATVERRNELLQELALLRAAYERTVEENKKALEDYRRVAKETLAQQKVEREKEERRDDVLKQTFRAVSPAPYPGRPAFGW